MSKRKLHASELKAKGALETLKGEETAAVLASRFGERWFRKTEQLPGVF